MADPSKHERNLPEKIVCPAPALTRTTTLCLLHAACAVMIALNQTDVCIGPVSQPSAPHQTSCLAGADHHCLAVCFMLTEYQCHPCPVCPCLLGAGRALLCCDMAHFQDCSPCVIWPLHHVLYLCLPQLTAVVHLMLYCTRHCNHRGQHHSIHSSQNRVRGYRG